MIVFIAPLTEASGNITTTERILGYLTTCGFGEVGMVDSNKTQKEQSEAFAEFESNRGIKLTVTLHAYKGGITLLKHMRGKKVTNITVFGGTDINEMVNDESKKNLMNEVLARSCRAVCFSEDLRNKAIAAFGDIPNLEYNVAPQAVVASTIHKGNSVQSLLRSFFSKHRLNSNSKLFIAPMGVRPVKDPLFLVRAFQKVHSRYPDAYCIVVGPVLDSHTGDELLSQNEEHSGVCYNTAISQQQLHELYTKDCVAAVINCSLSEGQPQAAMEGMRLGTTALLRSISGNLAIAEDSVTALFFHDEDSFADQAIKIISSDCSSISSAGQVHVISNFGIESESRFYASAVKSAYNS